MAMTIDEFKHISIHCSDVYIVDYTHQTKNLRIKRGVELHERKPVDIEGLFVENLQQIRFRFVNFEKNLLFLDGLLIEQCECMCISEGNLEENKWLMLAELKYCEEKNAKPNLSKAYKQLMSTFNYLKSKQFIDKSHKTYLIISLPRQSNAPFENFIFTPSQLAEMRKRDNIILRGVNKVSIVNSNKLKV